MNKEQVRLAYRNFAETGRQVVVTGVVHVAMAAGAGAGAYAGYRIGDYAAPEAETIPGKALEHIIELASVGALGAIGAMVGFGVGVWMVHEDGLGDIF